MSDTSTAPIASRKPLSVRRKTAAREAAIQSLYAEQFQGSSPSHLLSPPAFDDSNPRIVPDSKHLERLLLGVREDVEALDHIIREHLSAEWRLERLSLLLHAILRASVFELLRLTDIPYKVVIDEYVTIAERFCDANDAKFVNGLLDRLARRERGV